MVMRDLEGHGKQAKYTPATLITLMLLSPIIWLILEGAASAATTQKHYFGHDAQEDQYGVIAPWYKGQNGQFDFRVRVAAETIKRYPWANRDRAVMAAPEYVFNGNWNIDSEGKITIPHEKDWENGDLVQRAAYVISSMLDTTDIPVTRPSSPSSTQQSTTCSTIARRTPITAGRTC